MIWTQEVNFYQDANTSTMYGLSKSFTIKFPFSFNILKYCFVTLRIFSLFYDGSRDMSVVVTYWTEVMFYEERGRMPSDCQPDESMNRMIKPDQP